MVKPSRNNYAVIPSRADNAVRLGPKDLTLVERANEFCEILRSAQDDSKGKSGTTEKNLI